jgi:hypothetical protein
MRQAGTSLIEQTALVQGEWVRGRERLPRPLQHHRPELRATIFLYQEEVVLFTKGV